MKLYTCSMRDCAKGAEFVLLGIFDSRAKAEHQAQAWLMGLGESYELFDWDDEYNFYRADSGNHYTAHFEEYYLNEISF